MPRIDPRKLRYSLGLSQAEFWTRLGVTQSGGSRYETGRKMPRPLVMLMIIAYGTEAQAMRIIGKIRGH